MPETFRSPRFGRIDVADSAAPYFHVKPNGTPMLMPNVDGGYPLLYLDASTGDYLCARCATVELLTDDRFAACVWTMKGSSARRPPVFRRWSRPTTRDPRDYSRRLGRWGRAVLTLPLTPFVHYEGEALTCDNCRRRVRSAYGPLARIRRDRSVGRGAVRERERRWKVIRHADVSAFYPRLRSVSP